jgi:hypothetical protein
MKAIVCDSCGKVVLLEDYCPGRMPTGFHRMIHDSFVDKVDLDICDECYNRLIEAVRQEK